MPYAVLDLPATEGRGAVDPAVEPALRPRRTEGVAGIDASVKAGVAPLLEAALLVARVVLLVDMVAAKGVREEQRLKYGMVALEVGLLKVSVESWYEESV